MKKIMISLLSIMFIITSCMRDTFVEAETQCGIEAITYNNQIGPIIDLTCAYVGCHDGNSQERYSSFQELENVINNGTFYSEVIETRDMPPSYDIVLPTVQLTDEQYVLLTCWAEAGFPEK